MGGFSISPEASKKGFAIRTGSLRTVSSLLVEEIKDLEAQCVLPILFGYYFVTNYVVYAWRRMVGLGGIFLIPREEFVF